MRHLANSRYGARSGGLFLGRSRNGRRALRYVVPVVRNAFALYNYTVFRPRTKEKGMATKDDPQVVAKETVGHGGKRRTGRPAGGNVGKGLRSKLTERGQTTVPSGVRKALGLQPGEEIGYEVRGDIVVMRRAAPGEDPVVSRFLEFLEADMMENPRTLTPFTERFAARLRMAAQGAVAEDDEILEGKVAL